LGGAKASGKFDSVNAMISAETESLQPESNYENSAGPLVPHTCIIGQSWLDAGQSGGGADFHELAQLQSGRKN
jgi:hypothetical protein